VSGLTLPMRPPLRCGESGGTNGFYKEDGAEAASGARRPTWAGFGAAFKRIVERAPAPLDLVCSVQDSASHDAQSCFGFLRFGVYQFVR
jgi:hypothetical protein